MTSKTATRIGFICFLFLITWLAWPYLVSASYTSNHPVPLSPDAGFPKAMTYPRKPVIVQRTTDPRVQVGMDYWNIAANWRLLKFAGPDADAADIDIFVNTTSGGDARWSSLAPYDHCTISIGAEPTTFFDWQVSAHELGHCLGWDSTAHRGWGIIAGYETHISYDRHQLQRAHYYRERLCNPTCQDG